MILLNISLGYYLIRNSPYAFHKDWIEPCETYWLPALLFIQNYYNTETMVNALNSFLTLKDYRRYFSAFRLHGIYQLTFKCT